MLELLLCTFAIFLLGTLIAPDEGEVLLLKYMLAHTSNSGQNPILRIYTSPTGALTDNNSYSSFVESTMAGYIRHTLTGTAWTISTSLNVTTASFAEKITSYTTSESAQGYYVTAQTSPITVLWAEKFTDGPFNLPSTGGAISITPKIVLD